MPTRLREIDNRPRVKDIAKEPYLQGETDPYLQENPVTDVEFKKAQEVTAKRTDPKYFGGLSPVDTRPTTDTEIKGKMKDEPVETSPDATKTTKDVEYVRSISFDYMDGVQMIFEALEADINYKRATDQGILFDSNQRMLEFNRNVRDEYFERERKLRLRNLGRKTSLARGKARMLAAAQGIRVGEGSVGAIEADVIQAGIEAQEEINNQIFINKLQNWQQTERAISQNIMNKQIRMLDAKTKYRSDLFKIITDRINLDEIARKKEDKKKTEESIPADTEVPSEKPREFKFSDLALQEDKLKADLAKTTDKKKRENIEKQINAVVVKRRNLEQQAYDYILSIKDEKAQEIALNKFLGVDDPEDIKQTKEVAEEDFNDWIATGRKERKSKPRKKEKQLAPPSTQYVQSEFDMYPEEMQQRAYEGAFREYAQKPKRGQDRFTVYQLDNTIANLGDDYQRESDPILAGKIETTIAYGWEFMREYDRYMTKEDYFNKLLRNTDKKERKEVKEYLRRVLKKAVDRGLIKE